MAHRDPESERPRHRLLRAGGDFVFAEGEAPSVPFGSRNFTPPTIPLPDFMQLTKIPIVIYYGDNIPEQASTNPGQEQWRVFLQVTRLWRDAVNRRAAAAQR